MSGIDFLLRARIRISPVSKRFPGRQGAQGTHARLFDLREDGVKVWLPCRRVHDDLLGLPVDLLDIEACPDGQSARCASRVFGARLTVHLGQDALHGPGAAAARHDDVERVRVLRLRVSFAV